MDPAVLRALADAGSITGLIAILWGGFRGWWIYGPQHERQLRDLKEDRDFWREQALRAGALAEKATEVAAGQRDA